MSQRSAKQLRGENSRRAKLAALRAAEQRRKRRNITVVSSICLVLALIAGMIVIKIIQGTSSSGSDKAEVAPSKVVQQVTSIATSTYNQVGLSKVSTGTNNDKVLVFAVPNAPKLISADKPEVLYVGAEYCPFCAAERWAVVAALARFGTFSGLAQTTSSSSDYAPDTSTLSFHNASFSSRYVAFKGFEIADRLGHPLDKVPASAQRIVSKYGRAPYVPGVPTTQPAPIPFIDFGGKYVISGASYDPAILHDMTHQQIAASINNPDTQISKSILTTANTMTAVICQETDDQPTSVCDSPGVKAAAAALPRP